MAQKRDIHGKSRFGRQGQSRWTLSFEAGERQLVASAVRAWWPYGTDTVPVTVRGAAVAVRGGKTMTPAQLIQSCCCSSLDCYNPQTAPTAH